MTALPKWYILWGYTVGKLILGLFLFCRNKVVMGTGISVDELNLVVVYFLCSEFSRYGILIELWENEKCYLGLILADNVCIYTRGHMCIMWCSLVRITGSSWLAEQISSSSSRNNLIQAAEQHYITYCWAAAVVAS